MQTDRDLQAAHHNCPGLQVAIESGLIQASQLAVEVTPAGFMLHASLLAFEEFHYQWHWYLTCCECAFNGHHTSVHGRTRPHHACGHMATCMPVIVWALCGRRR